MSQTHCDRLSFTIPRQECQTDRHFAHDRTYLSVASRIPWQSPGLTSSVSLPNAGCMIPLLGAGFPDSSEALRSAIREGFARHQLTARQVTVQGGAYPQVDRLDIDLSGATATRELRAPKSGTPASGSLNVAQMEVQASPLLLEGTPLQLQLEAKDVTLQHTEGTADESTLTVKQAAQGRLTLEMAQKDLESLLHKIVSGAAAGHGAEILETHIALTSQGPKSLSFKADVVAKMFIVKAPLTITGDLAIDDDLNLRVSNLALSGGGVAAGVAGNFIRPQFEKIQKQPISLAMLSLGEVKLRDVGLEAGDTIRLYAEFGSAA